MNRAQFMRTYRRLTPNKRARTAIVVDVKDEHDNLFATPYSWNDLYREIIKDSETSRRLLEVLE